MIPGEHRDISFLAVFVFIGSFTLFPVLLMIALAGVIGWVLPRLRLWLSILVGLLFGLLGLLSFFPWVRFQSVLGLDGWMFTSLGWDLTTTMVVGLIIPPYTFCTLLMLLTLILLNRRTPLARVAPPNDERAG